MQTEEGLNEMIRTLAKHPVSSTDSEFRPGPRHTKRPLLGWSFAVRENRGYHAWYVPLGHDLSVPQNRAVFKKEAVNISPALFLRKMRKFFQSGDNIKVCHSCETEDETLKVHANIELNAYRDTMIESWLFEEDELYPYRLKEVSAKVLGVKIKKIEEVNRGKRVKASQEGGAEKYDLYSTPIDAAAVYATDDAISTLRLNEWIEPELVSEEIFPAYERIELPMVKIFRDMGLNGVHIDIPLCTKMRDRVVKRIGEVECDVYKVSGEPFNIRSRQQLGRILFEKLKYPEMKITDPQDPEGKALITVKTPTGQYKTSDDVMEWLAAQGYPVATLLQEHGDLEKIRGTYLQGFLDSVDSEGVYHPSIWQCGTVTGRGSGDMQQIPRPDKDFDINWKRAGFRKLSDDERIISIRKLVCVPDGYHLIDADYNQLELRLLAHYTQDPVLVGCYQNGEDLHQGTCDTIRAAAKKFVKAEIEKSLLKKALEFSRQDSKPVNFGLVYGLALATFIEMFGEDIGRAVHAALMERFQAAFVYKNAAVHLAHLEGFIRSLAWRKRRLHDINADDPRVRGYVERQAFNARIQGSAADVVKMAQIACWRKLPEAKQILQVHDEILFRYHGTLRQAKELAKEIKKVMESVVKLNVPLISDPGIGRNWLEAKG